MGRSIAWLSGQEQVDMVRLDGELQDAKLVDFSTIGNQASQSILDLALEDALAVLGNPDEVVLDIVGGITGRLLHATILARCSLRSQKVSHSSPALKGWRILRLK